MSKPPKTGTAIGAILIPLVVLVCFNLGGSDDPRVSKVSP